MMDSQHPILLQLKTEFDQKLGHLTKEYHDVISVYAHARNMEFEEALDIAGVFPISI